MPGVILSIGTDNTQQEAAVFNYRLILGNMNVVGWNQRQLTAAQKRNLPEAIMEMWGNIRSWATISRWRTRPEHIAGKSNLTGRRWLTWMTIEFGALWCCPAPLSSKWRCLRLRKLLERDHVR